MRLGEGRVLINFSNHPNTKWNCRQREFARDYGKIVDIPFPLVPGEADEKEIDLLTDEYVKKIVELLDDDPESAVMVQGEYTLTYAVVTRLRDRGIRTISAVSDREVSDSTDKDGNSLKITRFCFDHFREYRP